ncbi:hypothetical protein PDJAM_G00238620 [Pangasius djambal]|uniref:Uncharacterized protein n=1 Tax=Pangasius djambal TaxID=1691987 RepID=A0ACC5YG32_9TELE|nr:hypothetical protein [Pangasius djambal]
MRPIIKMRHENNGAPLLSRWFAPFKGPVAADPALLKKARRFSRGYEICDAVGAVSSTLVFFFKFASVLVFFFHTHTHRRRERYIYKYILKEKKETGLRSRDCVVLEQSCGSNCCTLNTDMNY